MNISIFFSKIFVYPPPPSPESLGGTYKGALPLEYLEEDYEAGVDALPQQLRFSHSNL